MTPADKVIEVFGGVSRLSKLLGQKNASTVSSWKQRGRIPTARQDELLVLAQRHNIPLEYKHFFNSPLGAYLFCST